MKLISSLFLAAYAVDIDIPAGSRGGRLEAVNQHLSDAQYQGLLGHGCWCPKFDANDDFSSGETLDDLDGLCREWQQMRNCAYLAGGACYNQPGSDAYTTTDDRLCSNTDECAQEACQIDAQFIGQIKLMIDNGAGFTAGTTDSCPIRTDISTATKTCAGRWPHTTRSIITYTKEMQVTIPGYDWRTHGCPSKQELSDMINAGLPESLQIDATGVECASLGFWGVFTSFTSNVADAVSSSLSTIVSAATGGTVTDITGCTSGAATPAVTSSDCGTTTTSSGGSIWSPNYAGPRGSNHYESNQECEFNYEHSAGSNGKYKVEFIGDFDIEAPGASNGRNNCPWDYVEVNGVKYCSGSSPRDIVTSGDELNIRFFSDRSVARRGFKLKYTELPATSPAVPSGCGGSKFPAAGETFASKNFPGVYDNFLDCEWELIPAEGKYAKLTVNSFDIENHSSCAYDCLAINGHKTCGTSVPASQILESGASLKFHSDYSVTKGGFSASFEDWPAEGGNNACNKPNTVTVDGSTAFEIRNYADSKNCDTVFITSNPSATLRYKFVSFEVENHASCNYDALTLKVGLNGASSKHCGEHTGSSGSPPGLNSWNNVASNVLQLNWATDSSQTRDGFKLVIESVGGTPPVPTVPAFTCTVEGLLGRSFLAAFGDETFELQVNGDSSELTTGGSRNPGTELQFVQAISGDDDKLSIKVVGEDVYLKQDRRKLIDVFWGARDDGRDALVAGSWIPFDALDIIEGSTYGCSFKIKSAFMNKYQYLGATSEGDSLSTKVYGGEPVGLRLVDENSTLGNAARAAFTMWIWDEDWEQIIPTDLPAATTQAPPATAPPTTTTTTTTTTTPPPPPPPARLAVPACKLDWFVDKVYTIEAEGMYGCPNYVSYSQTPNTMFCNINAPTRLGAQANICKVQAFQNVANQAHGGWKVVAGIDCPSSVPAGFECVSIKPAADVQGREQYLYRSGCLSRTRDSSKRCPTGVPRGMDQVSLRARTTGAPDGDHWTNMGMTFFIKKAIGASNLDDDTMVTCELRAAWDSGKRLELHRMSYTCNPQSVGMGFVNPGMTAHSDMKNGFKFVTQP